MVATLSGPTSMGLSLPIQIIVANPLFHNHNTENTALAAHDKDKSKTYGRDVLSLYFDC